jgi:hypothetical protein
MRYCGVRASRGVGVLLYDIDATVKEINSDDFGRILSCELKYENKTYIITNVPIYIYSCNRN